MTSALAFELTAEQLRVWNTLPGLTNYKQEFNDCKGEISTAIEQAKEVYGKDRLSENFIKALQGIQTVAGDIPETLLFRYTVGNYTKVVQEEYKNQFDLKQKEEQAKAEAEAAAASSSAAAAATKTTAFYVRPTNPADKDTTYTVQSQDAPKSENENPAYGISSSSIQNSVFAGLGLLSYFLL